MVSGRPGGWAQGTLHASEQQMKAFLNRIHHGDCIEGMRALPDESVDVVFADPPYGLRLHESAAGQLYRPDHSVVSGVDAEWDRFEDPGNYHAFTRAWLTEARRVLKRDGTIWVIGTYHNIYVVGAELQALGFWTLNDVIWRKMNPMPNFRGRRFTNAHETLLWCARSARSRYVFNYSSMKRMNDDLQMRSDWLLPICTGGERLKTRGGGKLHPTQKPEALMYRVIIASTLAGQTVLDPFAGSGTTAAVCRMLGRSFVAFEREAAYIEAARARVEAITPITDPSLLVIEEPRAAPRIPFGSLLEAGLLVAGEELVHLRSGTLARVRADGSLVAQREGERMEGSIHQLAARIESARSCNGWTAWYLRRAGQQISIDVLRSQLRDALRDAA